MTTTAPDTRRPARETAPSLDPRERQRLERAFSVPRARFLLGIPVAIVVLLWSFQGAEFNFAKLGEGAGLSLLVAFGAASNIAPKWLYFPSRWLMNIIRSVPDLVFALMFVSAVGLGPFAGILAMTLGSLGSIGKIFAEAMESVDRGPIVAMEAVGASRRQVIQYGILPQAAPLLVSYTLLLFEGNVRGATILGLVGAGGIGLELTTAMRMYDYGHLSAIIICIIVLVTVIDQGSAFIRRRIT
ncbi:phosphonate ABC transporter, permease protein PhnE [Salinibacterium sp. SYSU T00001]|uniref:phosphonate ABC transporter, permease protein PhnE n=1 Tax=Homoserinimonas sedimenticola TaxID=2986805 RepID=UPI002235F5BE|nr:phosphonate ABC transporter, permease protein PhnE [Salinibacterium sedimenticola]MCW4385371.1 phosphonate ABC transporter, permease protein PhnE [Salinibacterium sedimenticola]